MNVAYAAAFWALVSAVIHTMWAAGWAPPVAAHPSQLTFATPLNWTFNVIVAVMSVIAVPVMLARITTWGRRLPGRLVYRTAWTLTALMGLRSAASLIKISYFVAAGQLKLAALGIWEPWFCLGTVLFVMSTRRASRKSW